MALGEKLLQLRKSKGLSQEQLAMHIAVSRQAVSKWELGETMPDTDNVVQLSKLLGVSTDFLLKDDEADEAHTEDNPSNAPMTIINIRQSALSKQGIAGIILACIGGIFLFMALWTGFPAALFLSVPLFVCSVVCLTVKKHLLLWLCWMIYLLVYGCYVYLTGMGFGSIFLIWQWRYLPVGRLTLSLCLYYGLLWGGVALIAVTGRLIYKKRGNK
ncbi:MAG: helix-turn-helix domain-containing protein [Peptococcaceae bacterium]|jgi:transcriptional regulator with XRE-family HTH domain|nr:helix-turn-helix domain-containing protein [Peptococcaceae bacterium]